MEKQRKSTASISIVQVYIATVLVPQTIHTKAKIKLGSF
jgi:hypothetical protein